jgi:putative serine protease PepD
MNTITEPGAGESKGADRSTAPPAAHRSTPASRRRWATRLVPLAVAALLGGVVAGGLVAAVGDNDASPPTTGVAIAPAVARSTFATRGTAESIEQIYRAAAPGVVQITQGDVEGSGFVIDKQGDIVTNAHVVTNGGAVTASFSNADQAPVRVVGVDASTDVALLKVAVPAAALVPLPLGDSSTLQVGDAVVAIGNPFGLDRSATNGIVSAIGRQIVSPNGFPINGAIQTNAAINHGNSGGPLLNAQGQVIGITSQIADSGVNANVGVGFAVPINTVKQVTADLKATGSVAHAWLGVSLAPVDPTIAAQAALPVSHGAMIAGVEAGGPAASAGLRAATRRTIIGGMSYGIGGDIVTAVNGTPISSPQDLQSAVEALRAGDKIALAVSTPTD